MTPFQRSTGLDDGLLVAPELVLRIALALLVVAGASNSCTTPEPAPPPAVVASTSNDAAPTAPVPAPVVPAAAPVAVESAAEGWTRLVPSVDTRRVFVDGGAGSDASDGLSPSTAKKSIAAGVALLRHGMPDWLLLKRGETWKEGLGQWKKSGRCASEPMVVATYGAAAERPRLETGADGGVWTHGGGGSPATIDHVAFVGLHFRPDAYRGEGKCVGAELLQPGSHVLIEDCEFEGYGINLVFQGYGGRHHDFKLRRSVIVDAWKIHEKAGHSQGLYAYAVDDLLIEENVFDHNGWNEAVPGAGADIFSHNLYIDNGNTGVVVRGNVIANASSHGLQLRPGGTCQDNLFVRNSIALSVGGGNNPEAGGVRAEVLGNVILDGRDIDARTPRGWGMWFANLVSGHVAWNVVADNTSGSQPRALTIDGAHRGDSRASLGVHDLRIEKNVFRGWGGGLLVLGDGSQVRDVDFCDNEVGVAERDVQEFERGKSLLLHVDPSSTASIRSKGNRVHPERASAGGRAAGDAVQCFDGFCRERIGVQGFAAFLRHARAQSRANWRPDLTAAAVNRHVRGGFDLIFG
jgi:hypothetical protein